MSNSTAIKVSHLTKIYKLYNRPIDRLKESLHPLKKSYHKNFYALNGINFEIQKGDTIGIIGKNGAGKSTLLKIITGVLTPSSGHIYVNGRISSLLELGAGFNPEYTGIENIYLQGTLLGYSKDELGAKIDDILAFADIGDFVYQPVKTYSSGMFARLAFAVAINVEPDILIVDEALSVGDTAFQAKCLLKMKNLQKKGLTLLFVSHSLSTIKSLCTQAIYLVNGKLMAKGNVKDVCQLYEKETNQQITGVKELITSVSVSLAKKESEMLFENKINDFFMKNASVYRAGTGEAEIQNILIMNNDNKIIDTILVGEKIKFRIFVHYKQDIVTEGTIGYMIKNMQGVDVVGYNIYNSAQLLPPMKANSKLIFDFEFVNLLSPGEYTVSIGLKAEPVQPVFLDQVQLAAKIIVQPIENNYIPGLVFLENNIDYKVLSTGV